jgi:hypothetical protein
MTDASPASPSPDRLPRKIGLWSAVAILVGTVIGSGIFRSPAVVADRLPDPSAILLVWVAGGAVVLCGALSLAELAGTFPETGGIYVFIREGWGRLPAFLFGWTELVVIRASALGAIATTFAEYLVRVTGGDPRIPVYGNWVHYIAAAAIALVGVLNYVGGPQWNGRPERAHPRQVRGTFAPRGRELCRRSPSRRLTSHRVPAARRAGHGVVWRGADWRALGV